MSPPSATRRLDLCLAAAVWLGTLAALFWPLARGVLTGAPRFFDWDVPEQYWPDLVRLCRDLHEGSIPYWSPHDRGGYPYYADPQAAPFHPVHWAMCAAGPDPSLHWATLKVVLGFLLSMIGAHVWLRRTDLGRDAHGAPHPHAAAALGACVMTTAPFLRHNWELNLTFAIAWLPWILWAADRLFSAPSARHASLLSLAVAFCAWSGSPPALWLTVTFVAGYVVARIVGQARGGGLGRVRTLAPWLLASLALCALLIAVVIVPGQSLSARSVQADHTFASLTAESLDTGHLIALVRAQAGNHLFLGPVVWFTTGAALWAPRTRLVAVGCVVTAVFAVLLTMGEHTPVFRFFFEHVPGFDRFRLPHRYEAWLGPVAALATMLGADALTKELARVRRSREAIASWSIALVLWVAHLSLVTERLDPERHTRSGPIPCRDADDPIARFVDDQHERVFDEFAIGCRSGTRLGHRDLRGYQDPLMLHTYERVLAHLAEHPALLRQYGVRYALTSPHFLHGWDHHYLPPPEALTRLEGARVVLRTGERLVIDLGAPVPDAYVVPDAAVIEVPSREEALAHVVAHAPAPMAVLESPEARRPTHEATHASSVHVAQAVDRSDPDRVIVSLDDAPSGVLVLGEVHDVGWTAEVDGAETEVLRVNALVRGVRVTRGARRVVFRYAPRDGRAGRALWALGWLLALGALAVPTRRKTP